MGTPKQMLRRDGLTLVERAVAALEIAVDLIVLAGDGPVPPALGGYRRLSDPPEGIGPLGGILAALKSDPGAVWVVAACDMPLIRPAAVAWLVSQRRSESWAVFPRVVPGRVEPLFAVYEPKIKNVLERRAGEGRFGFQDLARSELISCPRPPDEIRDAWTNVNTLEQFRNSAVLDV